MVEDNRLFYYEYSAKKERSRWEAEEKCKELG